MSTIVFATPAQFDAPPKVDPFTKLSMMWHGIDGSVWDLYDDRAGVFLTRGGVKGLYLPPFERETQTYAGLPGAQFYSTRATERTVEWPVSIFSDTSSDEFLDVHQRWWKSMSPNTPGIWEVRRGGESRFLSCRLSSDGEFAPDIDPSFHGAVNMLVELIADQPFWQGTPITDAWSAPEPALFFGGQPVGGTQAGPPFAITSSSTFADAKVTNNGNEATSAIWTVHGQVSAGSTITVDGGTLVLPAVGVGETLVINTSPEDPMAELDGVDVSGLVDQREAMEFPPGVTTPIQLDIIAGPGARVVLEAPTKYWRAFG